MLFRSWAALGQAMRKLSADDSLRCVVVRGAGEKAFAAGADIAAMQGFSYMDAYLGDYIGNWEHFRKIRKPVIRCATHDHIPSRPR